MTDILLLVLIILVLRLVWQLANIAETLFNACGFLELLGTSIYAAVGQPAVDSQSNADQTTSTESIQS